MLSCKKCGSERAVKSGIVAGKQRYCCKNCGCNFREGDNRTSHSIAAKKAFLIMFYALGKGSYRMLGRIFGIDHTLVYRWIRSFGESLPEPEVSGEIKRMEFDEMWHFIGSKKKKLWVIKALCSSTRRTVAWVLGNRDSATFRKLYDKVKHLKNCVFYTDKWNAFAEVLPPERHIIGKKHTVSIERDNSNTRHHLGRFTRRTKVVSQNEYMVDLSLRIWHAITTTDLFFRLQETMLSIF